MRERILDFLSDRGTLAEPEVIEYLLRQEDPIASAAKVIDLFQEPPMVITLENVLRTSGIGRAATTRFPLEVATVVVAPPTPPEVHVRIEAAIPASFRRSGIPAPEIAEDLRILKDITGRSTCEGTLADFSRYFHHRFTTLSRILRSRPEGAGAIEIARAKRLSREVKMIGIVRDVRPTKNGHRIVELEDDTDTVSVLLLANSSLAADPIVHDEVIGVVGTSNERGLMIAKSILHPDLPTAKSFPRTRDRIRVAFMSDIHVGSRTFLADRWAKFRDWVTNGDELARSLRYLVVSGDVVDGIGVYPRQDEELVIDDIYAQYEALAGMCAEMPDHLKIVLLPGNHDAVRPAEPQPALPPPIQKLFDSNVVFGGNPCTLSIHGVRILGYHGRSMDDFVSALPAMTYARPLDAMREMLRKRHLAPIYGGKTPIAPEAEDHLIIDQVPDVFVTGHVHAAAVGEHRGVILVNSSTWQAQTSYQKMHNIEPMPARLPILDIHTGEAFQKSF
ncbi:MAG: DNA-directed DNA polymerase II small subunit [Candidatus Thermoplasmatota archaeon]